MRQFAFLRVGQSVHAFSQRSPRSLQGTEIVLYRLEFILGPERSRRLDYRSQYVKKRVKIPVEFERYCNVLRRSSQLTNDFGKRHLQIALERFDICLAVALGIRIGLPFFDSQLG